MFRERLLERVKHLEAKSSPRGLDDVQAEVDSILDHVKKLLNTRQGSARIAPDYGIPDLTNLGSDNFSLPIRQVEQSILQAVTKYESRLTNVRITAEADNQNAFTKKFRLEGVLKETRSYPVIFETVISSDGHVNVTET